MTNAPHCSSRANRTKGTGRATVPPVRLAKLISNVQLPRCDKRPRAAARTVEPSTLPTHFFFVSAPPERLARTSRSLQCIETNVVVVGVLHCFHFNSAVISARTYTIFRGGECLRAAFRCARSCCGWTRTCGRGVIEKLSSHIRKFSRLKHAQQNVSLGENKFLLGALHCCNSHT
jgi:hypothetical protein